MNKSQHLLFIFFWGLLTESEATNELPIVGILSQELNSTGSLEWSQRIKQDPPPVMSYIASSYIKFLEAGGLRVVPIHIGRPNNSYAEVINSINGYFPNVLQLSGLVIQIIIAVLRIFFPGGNISITDSQYAAYGRYLFVYAQMFNEVFDYFPIWATGTGFHLLASLFLTAGTYSTDNCTAWDIALPLKFTSAASSSRLFGNLPANVSDALTNENVTANYHYNCLTPQKVNATGLNRFINILSTSVDANGKEFVSTYEAIDYPFYATQWHPEKSPWEWPSGIYHIPHTPSAIRVTQYFASFFASEARKSEHAFSTENRETAELIYNLNPTYSGKTGSEFTQIYDFAEG